jgi:hypothetical protein
MSDHGLQEFVDLFCGCDFIGNWHEIQLSAISRQLSASTDLEIFGVNFRPAKPGKHSRAGSRQLELLAIFLFSARAWP